MDGEDGVLTKHGLREESKLATDSDMWSNLGLGEGKPLYSRQFLGLWLLSSLYCHGPSFILWPCLLLCVLFSCSCFLFCWPTCIVFVPHLVACAGFIIDNFTVQSTRQAIYMNYYYYYCCY
jgi:hypothetical protein